jgi:hypothetical protein
MFDGKRVLLNNTNIEKENRLVINMRIKYLQSSNICAEKKIKNLK